MSVAKPQTHQELARELLALARAGRVDQLELHGINLPVRTLIQRCMEAEQNRDAAVDALDRRVDAMNACHQALELALRSMLRG